MNPIRILENLKKTFTIGFKIQLTQVTSYCHPTDKVDN